jgi:hypothetical protein
VLHMSDLRTPVLFLPFDRRQIRQRRLEPSLVVADDRSEAKRSVENHVGGRLRPGGAGGAQRLAGEVVGQAGQPQPGGVGGELA